jgi:hypothetical protein
MEQIQVLESPCVEEWLAEKRTANTRRTYERRLRQFLTYHQMTPEEYLNLPSKRQRTLALKFQNEQPDKNPNTIYSVLTAVGSFVDHHDKPIRWKRARVKPRPDVSSHVFSNGDLEKMFQIGNVKEKGMLALATSLGWEIRGVLKLKRKTLRDLIDRAKDTGQKFVYFKNVREKTGAQRLGILNPLAIEWVDKWLQQSENMKPMKRKHDREARINIVSEVFDLTGEGFNIMLKRLARKAQIKTTGRVRFHAIRKWVMSGLSRSGFNEFQIKYVLGKAIPMSDLVYLQSLEQEVRERYPEAYEHYLNLNPTVSPKAMNTLSKELEEKSAEIEELKTQVSRLEKLFIDAIDTFTGQPHISQADNMDAEIAKMIAKKRKNR